ncbi:MAG: AcrR family transcriptional regulator [Marinomonas primoryensis]|jgi:AcrR family transcriptional regulator
MPDDRIVTKRDKTRSRILNVAAVQFSKYGYNGVSMDGLGKACLLTKGALYGHFNGKDDIYTQCVTQYVEKAISDIFCLSSRGDDFNSEEKILSFFENFFIRIKGDIVLRRLLQRLIIDSKDVDLKSVYEIALLKPFSYVVDLLVECRPRINAKIHIYSFFCLAIVGEDLRIIAEFLSPEFEGIETTSELLEQFKQGLFNVPCFVV